MQKSEIKFEVTLDQEKIPEKIHWHATDNLNIGIEETQAISVSVWDDEQKNALRIDLWTKDMPIHAMKKFCIDTIGGLAQSILTATGDEYMAKAMNTLCDQLVVHVQKKHN